MNISVMIFLFLFWWFFFRDWVEVYDGSDENAESLGRFCGHNPGVITSTGDSLFFRFRSDEFNDEFVDPTNAEVKIQQIGFRVIVDTGTKNIF